MVMAKPMQLTIVKDVPLDASGAFWATKVENKGESATTTIPQKKRKINKIVMEFWDKKKGEIKQQIQEDDRAKVAIFLGLKRSENCPLNTQDKKPEAMIRKEKSGTFKSISGN